MLVWTLGEVALGATWGLSGLIAPILGGWVLGRHGWVLGRHGDGLWWGCLGLGLLGALGFGLLSGPLSRRLRAGAGPEGHRRPFT